MENSEAKTMPRIIDRVFSFSCFAGAVSGSIELSVYDGGSDDYFESIITVNTNVGNGHLNFGLTGDDTINKNVAGIDLVMEISNWAVSPSELSFQIKLSCNNNSSDCSIFEGTVRGQRGNG